MFSSFVIANSHNAFTTVSFLWSLTLCLPATDVVTVYVFQEPSLLSSLQDKGLTDVVLHALLIKDVSGVKECFQKTVVKCLPFVSLVLCNHERSGKFYWLLEKYTHSSWKAWNYFWVRFTERREINAVLLTVFKKILILGMHSNVYESVWIKFSMLPQPVGLLKLAQNYFCVRKCYSRERTLLMWIYKIYM